MTRERVVILGGGMAGLTTAWELSSGEWRDRFESITLYQRGWRLGGKGASSRGRHGRIEEHGLHVLLGYYDATFRVLREVYDELDRSRSDPDCPIRTWRDAFLPSGMVGLADRHAGQWLPFVTSFSTNDLLPGEPGAEDRALRPLDIAVRALQLLVDFHRSVAPAGAGGPYLSASSRPRTQGGDLQAVVRSAGLTALATVLAATERAARITGGQSLTGTAAASLVSALGAWRDGIREAVTGDPRARRTWELVDLVLTNLQGMATDGLLSGEDLSKIDDIDYREWLRHHGAAPETVDSAIVRGMYDLTFAYEEGDRSRPRFSAGLGLQLSARMLFDFKGSIFWRMQAGMGEVVFAPMYEALVGRGVEFHFFHRLDRLELGPDRQVRKLILTRQAELAGDHEVYQPLMRIGGVPCWPDRPDSRQLEDDPGDDLESHWWAGPGASEVTLTRGVDYDLVVLAVSLGMVPHVAAELIEADAKWAAMVREVATVATRSAQLWLSPSEEELGWQGPAGVTLSGFGQTFDTWASMTHLLPMEKWPAGRRPQSLAYFCGAMPDVPPSRGEEEVALALDRFLEREVSELWPESHGPGGFKGDSVVGRYLRANLDLSDRYVQSLPGTGKFRIAPGETGFENLIVAGDWTACGLDAGCIEAATRSGVLAARAANGRVGTAGQEDVA